MIRPDLLSLPFALILSFSAAAGSMDIHLTCRDESPCTIRGTAVLRSVADPATTRSIPISSNTMRISEASGTEWELSVAAPGFWAPSERIAFSSPETEQARTIRMWRTGRVHATVQAKDAALPSVRLMVTSPPSPRRAPEIPGGSSFDCLPAKQPSAWTCELPATTLDVAIRSEGYAPHYVWDVNVPAGGAATLGDITLRKGGSLLAWLDPQLLAHVERPVLATLRREVMPAASPAAARLAEPIAEAVFSKKGAIQMSPLPAGRYLLEVRSEGYVPARLPVEIFEGRESAVRRMIALSPSVNLRLRIEPPLAPGDVPWQLELFREVSHGSGSESAGKGTASAAGMFEVNDQSEGLLRVVVYDGRRNVFASREITIAPGGGEYTLTLHPLRVTGIVKLGGEALPRASLLFGGRSGREKVVVKADEEGRFTVGLPRAGEWVVDVTAASEAVAATTKVKIAEGAESVEIGLPATEISGWVLDAVGERLPKATVEVWASDGIQSRVADDAGAFRFRGVAPGVAGLTARDSRTGEYSSMARLTLRDEHTKVENVELKIESLQALKGVVRSAGVPVIGARVHAWAFSGGTAQQQRATTDLQGRFSSDIPGSANYVILIVGAAGRTLQPFRVVPGREELVLDVAPRGGELRLRWPTGTKTRITYNDNILMPLDELLAWAHSQGRRPESGGVAVPDLAPGRYQLCAGATCAAGDLAVGSALDLDLTPLLSGTGSGGQP